MGHAQAKVFANVILATFQAIAHKLVVVTATNARELRHIAQVVNPALFISTCKQTLA